jgi:hypothetical protein
MYQKWLAHHRKAIPLPSPIIVTHAPQARGLPEEEPSNPEFRKIGEKKWMK